MAQFCLSLTLFHHTVPCIASGPRSFSQRTCVMIHAILTLLTWLRVEHSCGRTSALAVRSSTANERAPFPPARQGIAAVPWVVGPGRDAAQDLPSSLIGASNKHRLSRHAPIDQLHRPGAASNWRGRLCNLGLIQRPEKVTFVEPRHRPQTGAWYWLRTDPELCRCEPDTGQPCLDQWSRMRTVLVKPACWIVESPCPLQLLQAGAHCGL